MNIRGVLLDIDGTLMSGLDPIPGASSAIRFLIENGIRYRFVSNGTRRSGDNVLKKLKSLEIPITPEDICTPAYAAIIYLQKKSIRACNLLITEDLMRDFYAAGIEHDPAAEYVVVGDAAERFTYDNMNRAFRSLNAGGELIALEKDRFWKDTDGLSLSAGPFVKALEYATGCRSLLIGKPSPLFFSSALEGFPEKGESLMIGDDIRTDVQGAQDAGLYGIITLTGKFTPEELESCEIEPDGIISSIAELPEFLKRSFS